MTRVLLNRRAAMALLGAAAFPQAAIARTGPAYPELNAFLNRYVDARKISGGVIAVCHGDRAPHYISAGNLSFDSAARMHPDSIFRIYSMTKPVTALAVMKLIEGGKLTLDQSLGDILPEFAQPRVLADPATMQTRPAAGPIRIRHLLTHTSGLGYSIGANPLAALYIRNGIQPGIRAPTPPKPGDQPPAPDLATMSRRLAALPLGFDPGSRYQYSVSHDVLGLVVQRVSGQSFDSYLRDNFFRPLGMSDTDFVVPAGKKDRLTTVYRVADGQLSVEDPRDASPFLQGRDILSGGGGLVSTARDYARFAGMLLNEGRLGRVSVVKPETARAARSNLMPPGVTFRGANGYGAGVSVVLPGGQVAGAEPAGSFGWFGMAGTQLWVDPVNRLAVVLMVQFMPTGAYPIGADIRSAAYRDLASAVV